MKGSRKTTVVRLLARAVLYSLPLVVIVAGYFGGGLIRKSDWLSQSSYVAVAWSDAGLQLQYAGHDSPNELGPWLRALDIRNRLGRHGNVLGFHTYRYVTSGLDVRIWQIPYWMILLISVCYPGFDLSWKLAQSVKRRRQQRLVQKASPHNKSIQATLPRA